MLAQLATFHAPDDLVLAVAAGPDRRAQWEWVKWLPHARHPTRSDALGAVRLVADTVAALEPLLDGISAHVVVVVDGAGAPRLAGAEGLTVVEVDGTPPRLLDPSTVVLTRRADGALETTTTDGVAVVGVADGLDLASASAVARRLAPLRLAGPGGGGDALRAADLGLLDLLGVAEPTGYTVADG